MLIREIQKGIPEILIRKTDLVSCTYRTCDICKSRITGTYYKVHGLTKDNPKSRFTNDVCIHCMDNFNLLHDQYGDKVSELYVARCIDPKHETSVNITADTPYYRSTDYDDRVSNRYHVPDIAQATENFIEFIIKTAKNFGIHVKEERIEPDDDDE